MTSHFPRETRLEAVRLYRESELSLKAVGERYGVSKNTVERWVREHDPQIPAISFLPIGGAAFGGIAIGGCAIGLIAFGGCALSILLAIGGFALGMVACGGCAVGLVVIGGAAMGYYAVGGGVIGVHVIDGIRQSPEAIKFFEQFIPGLAEMFKPK